MSQYKKDKPDRVCQFSQFSQYIDKSQYKKDKTSYLWWKAERFCSDIRNKTSWMNTSSFNIVLARKIRQAKEKTFKSEKSSKSVFICRRDDIMYRNLKNSNK